MAFSKKPTLTTHFNTMCTHTQAGIKAGKNQLPQCALLVQVEMPPEQGFDHEGTLKLSLETHTAKIFYIMIADRARRVSLQVL